MEKTIGKNGISFIWQKVKELFGRGFVDIKIEGRNLTLVRENGQELTKTTQDTTYSSFVKSGSNAKAGLVPAPSTTAGTTKYLREDGIWQTPTDTVYTHPTTSGNKHIPTGGSEGQVLKWSEDGTAKWEEDKDTRYTIFKGSTAMLAGTSGLVPIPVKGQHECFLKGDGTWSPIELPWVSGEINRNTTNTTGGTLFLKYSPVMVACHGTSIVLKAALASGSDVEIGTIVSDAGMPNNAGARGICYIGKQPILVFINTSGVVSFRNLGTVSINAGASASFRVDFMRL